MELPMNERVVHWAKRPRSMCKIFTGFWHYSGYISWRIHLL